MDQDEPFTPPAPVPGHRGPLRHRLRQIESWPREVFETAAWRPPIPGMPIFIMDPDAVHAVFVDQAEDFPQGSLWKRLMSPVWGGGIAVAEGADWRWQRRAAAAAFRPAHLGALVPSMAQAAERALDRWRAADTSLDMVEEAARITFDVILDAVLSGGEDFDRATLRPRIGAFVAQLGQMRLSYFIAPDAFHAGRPSTATADGETLREEVARMVRRRRTAAPRGDLVDLLLAATDPETGRAMDDVTVRDNLLGFIVAGHETSAMALGWAIFLVSQHAATARRLRQEALDVAGDRPIGAQDVDRLVFARQVIQETMRLYPPGFSLTRVAARTVEAGGVRIRQGERVLAPVYAIHRHRKWWRDPDVFDPDRFAAPLPDRRVYMPFGAGPRFCLGAAFAMTELVVALATLARRADFHLTPGHRVWPVADLALRPEGGLPMGVTITG